MIRTIVEVFVICLGAVIVMFAFGLVGYAVAEGF